MTQEPMTLYKLIILYMLDCVSFPLTKAQIDSFILDKEYTTYLTLQQAFAQLEESDMLAFQTIHNRTQLHITNEGKSTLHFFENNISEVIKSEIKDYLKENSISLRNEVSITNQYYRTTRGTYEVHLVAMERGEPLIDLKLNVPDANSASTICDQWQKKNELIYEILMKELL